MESKLIFINKLLNKMTLKEKIGQMSQYGRQDETILNLLKEGLVGSLLNVYGTEKINELQKMAVEETRLGIPLLIGDDVIHGFQTIFPIPIATASTWDLPLIEEGEKRAAIEAKAQGINWIFTPMVDISRDPRWGRIAEGAGEDHYLGKKIAGARVRGIQTNINQHPVCAACPKHFVGYGASIGGRDYNNVDISDHYLRSYYLPPFQEAIDNGCLTIMCSFNDLNSRPLSANKYAIDTLLKKEMAFDGFVVSDWLSIQETIAHRISKDRKDAAKNGLMASVDMDMHSGIYYEYLEELIAEKPDFIELINDSVKRILSVKYELGLFENSYVPVDNSKYSLLKKDNKKFAREIASKSIILLKNDKNLLPLKDDGKSIALIGPFSNDKINHLGCWSWKGKKDEPISISEALCNQLKNSHIMVDEACTFREKSFYNIDKTLEVAKNSDMIILALGEDRDMSGENHNRAHLDLPGNQNELIEALSKLNKPLVAIVSAGRPLTINLLKEKADAILWTWHLGIEAGNAVYDILFGNVNPQGKLPVTIPKEVGQIPLYYNHKSTGRPETSKYIDCDDLPLYPFGYGLSYANFTYKNFTINNRQINRNDDLEINVTVTNNSLIEGYEIIQVYFKDHVASTTQPVKQLCGFKKELFMPNESKVVHFNIPAKNFGLIDVNNEFTIENGDFSLFIGPNSLELLEEFFTIL